MQKLREKAIAVMRSNKHHGFFSLATCLLALSLLYGIASRLRRYFYANAIFPKFNLTCPVISVGNLTVGGTGKTPMVMGLARWLQQQGFKVAVVSRGYKGQAENRIAVVSDGDSILCEVGESGDEPFLMANRLKGVPIVVGKDRVEAGRTAIDRFRPDVIILDDAFQHQRLERDLNILLLDAQAPFGNGFLLPRGVLREPVQSIQRADAIIFTRCREMPPTYYSDIARKTDLQAIFSAYHRPVIRCVLPPLHSIDADALMHMPDGIIDHLSGRRLFAFSGLARNDSFWKSIDELGGQMCGKMAFDDHYAYHASDIDTIVHMAQKAGSDSIVTTEKDFVRLPKETTLPMDLIVLGVSIDFKEHQASWYKFIAEKLSGLKGF